MMRYFAIGDIHGCDRLLKRLLRRIDCDPKTDALVFLGDYIDRGKSSFEVIERLLAVQQQYDKVIFLKGNHEWMLARFLSGIDADEYMANGGMDTITSYRENVKHADKDTLFPETHLSFFRSLRMYYETEAYIFVHAGLRPEVTPAKQREYDMLWIREPFVSSEYDFGKRVIFGHSPLKNPLIMKNKIGIDTGAVYGNRLTCVRLPDLTFFTVG